MGNLQNQIVKNTIFGVLTAVGLGITSGLVWGIKTVVRHETQFQLYGQEFTHIKGDVSEVKQGIKDIKTMLENRRR